MRSPKEQEEFLAYRRFGERKPSAFNLLAKIGFAFLAMGCVCLGFITLLGLLGTPGSDGGGFLMGLVALCGVVGVLFLLCGLALGPVKKRER